jgi:hypothetical protein
MADELTPWEEINPPMVSAQLPEQRSQSSANDTRTVFRNELTACLALTAPVGMTEESRREWLAVAWDTLRHLPPDVLASGARKARQICDHPSKIVPTIVSETKDQMQWKREGEAEAMRHRQLPSPKPEYVTPEEASEILEQYGLKRSNGGG